MYSMYTPVHLVESVENCRLCMRRYLACSSYANVMHRELAITRVLRHDASARDLIMRNCILPSLPLSCTGFNFYRLEEVNRSVVLLVVLRSLLLWRLCVTCETPVHKIFLQRKICMVNIIFDIDRVLRTRFHCGQAHVFFTNL